ncbi:MAG TPA: BTAD domain-containing putative transcriptional regulator [Gaiellaceae bacterium]|nr:BTAD domain-containing putative transcriptional regulator [Gaiellaceae bacterium]
MHPQARDHIEFRLLGPVEAVQNGAAIALGGRRQESLLALLLLEPGAPVSAERLAEELWDGVPPPGAATTIRSYVSRLRSGLGGTTPIVAAGRGYSLQTSPESIDAKRFERLVRQGGDALERRSPRRAAENLRAALALWRGPPFFGLTGSPALAVEAERLTELRVLALEGRIEAELKLGAHGELVPDLEALVREHPYRERLWRHLMLALYRAGRQADALTAYRQAREVLDRELGIEPSDELRRLERAILLHEVQSPHPPEGRSALPAPLASFVGRAADVAELERLLVERRLVTLTGVGGVGKTRLALEVAARSATRARDGVVFVDFAALRDPPLVPAHVARALDLREEAGRDALEQLVERLRDAELLLVLDNCEHLRAACAALVRRLLAACARLRVLATSREVLGTPGEVDYAVPPLAVPPPDADPDRVGSSDAVRLFLARARDVRPHLSDDEATTAAAARICRELDGLPLAIELAAARAKALSLAEIADHLTDRFAFLVSPRRATAARHQTLEEAMAWSYELLPADEQRLLARLSVFVGGFTLDAAAAVCLPDSKERALPLVEHLVDASLVLPEERDGEMRYRLLETVRRYAAERLAEAGETPELRRRHAEYVAALAEAAEDVLRRRHSLESRWGARLHAEFGNLTAALAWSAEDGTVETGLRIVSALARFWIERDYAAEADRWLELLLQRSDETSTALRAKASIAAWNVASVRGDTDRAERHARCAVDLYAAAPEDAGAAWAFLALGAMHEQRGEWAEGRQRLEQALERHRASGDEFGIRRSLHLLGNIARETRDIERARALLGEALAHARASGDPFHEAAVLHSLGDAELDAGEGDAADAFYATALEIARRIGGRRIATYSIGGLAASATARGDDAVAAQLWSAAQLLEREVGFRMRATARNRYERALTGVRENGGVFADLRGPDAVIDAAAHAARRSVTA